MCFDGSVVYYSLLYIIVGFRFMWYLVDTIMSISKLQSYSRKFGRNHKLTFSLHSFILTILCGPFIILIEYYPFKLKRKYFHESRKNTGNLSGEDVKLWEKGRRYWTAGVAWLVGSNGDIPFWQLCEKYILFN